MNFKGFFLRSILIFSCIAINLFSFAQERFKAEWLQNPARYAKEIESNCSYKELTQFELPQSGHFKQLFNDYAKASISNAGSWKSGMSNVVVDSVDIVFTKYPKHKEDWITNYYSLLANRLLALFAIDPSLNSMNVQFNLLVQTNCQTEDETKAMFHGIIIHFNLIEKSTAAASRKKPESPSIPQTQNFRADQDYEFTPKPQRNYPKKKEKKRTVKQECPDFSKKKVR